VLGLSAGFHHKILENASLPLPQPSFSPFVSGFFFFPLGSGGHKEKEVKNKKTE